MSPRDLVNASDAELVVLVREGSDGAFDVLYRRHAARVAGVCRRRVQAHEVDDIVQDVFLRAHAHLGQLRDPAAVGAWLRTIAVRCCAERHRGVTPVAVDVDDAVIVLHDEDVPVDEHVVRQEDAAAVHRNLRSLSVRDREALWLRDALDVPISDIAARFGTTEGSTRVLLTRARRRMKAAYVAAIAWLVALGKGKLDRAAELAPVAAGVVAANAIVIAAVVVGLTNDPGMRQQQAIEAAPRVEVATTAPSDQTVSAAPLVAAPSSSVTETSPVSAPSLSDPEPTSSQVDEVGVRREPAAADAETWEVTVEDGQDQPLFGLWMADASDDNPDEDPDEDARDDDEGDDDLISCLTGELLTSESCG